MWGKLDKMSTGLLLQVTLKSMLFSRQIPTLRSYKSIIIINREFGAMKSTILCIFFTLLIPVEAKVNSASTDASKQKPALTEKYQGAPVSIGRGFVRAMPGVSTSTAAYLDIHNGSEQNLTLLGAKSELGMVMLHSVEDQDGMVMMKHLDSLPVPAKQTVKLKQGGLHLMITHIKEMPKRGESVDFTLQFAEIPPVKIALVVQ